jgi:hypothetical protein
MNLQARTLRESSGSALDQTCPTRRPDVGAMRDKRVQKIIASDPAAGPSGLGRSPAGEGLPAIEMPHQFASQRIRIVIRWFVRRVRGQRCRALLTTSSAP